MLLFHAFLGSYSENHCLYHCVEVFLLFSVVRVSGPTLKSSIYFELILYKVSSREIRFLHMGIQFSQHHLLIRLSFLQFIVPLARITWSLMYGFFSRSLFCSIVLVSVFMPVPYCFGYFSSVVCLEIS